MMQPEFEAILASDLPEAEKLARASQFINDDVAALRRGLIEAGLLTRENNIYQRSIS